MSEAEEPRLRQWEGEIKLIRTSWAGGRGYDPFFGPKARLLLGETEGASLPADPETESIDSVVKKVRPRQWFTLIRGNAQAAPTKKSGENC